MPLSRLFPAILIFTLGLMLVACASTELTQVWSDKAYNGGYLKTLLVVAQVEDQKMRRTLENGFINEFKEAGVRVMPSHTAALKPEADMKTIHFTAQRIGAEAIMLTTLKTIEDKEIEFDLVPPTTTSEEFGGGYQVEYQQNYQPGYSRIVTQTVIDCQIVLKGSGNKIWSANSEATDAESLDQIMKELPPMIVEDLRFRKMVK